MNLRICVAWLPRGKNFFSRRFTRRFTLDANSDEKRITGNKLEKKKAKLVMDNVFSIDNMQHNQKRRPARKRMLRWFQCVRWLQSLVIKMEN